MAFSWSIRWLFVALVCNGLEFLLAAQLDRDFNLNKPGTCPEAIVNEECPPTQQIQNDCLVDGDCPGQTKCCTDGCQLKCLQPKQIVPSKVCTVPVDLGFLIDASGSIGAENFGKIKEFVKRIVDAFDVGEEGTHVGAIWYSDTAELAFSFKNFTGVGITKANIFKAVDTIQVTTGKTRIDQALRLAYSDMYSEKGGVRFDKPKILLVMTDGRQTRGADAPDAEDLHIASKPLKELGVQVYSLGIGADYDIGELLDIASDDASVFRAAGFDELLSIVASITEQTCKGCTRAVDVHFALDSSNNLNPAQFDLLRNFLKAFADKFVISTRADRGAHLSVSVFADDAKVVFDLYKGNSQEELRRLVDTIPHLQESGSNMDKALRLVKRDIFSLKGGTRQSAAKVLILITAGNCATCKEPLGEAAQPLKEGGVQVISLGIGNRVDQTDLEKIASYPTKANLFRRQGIEQLINAVFIQKISESACKGKKGRCPTTERPKHCPVEITFKCEVDTDCPNDEKCCLDPCDKTCVPPKLSCITPLDISFVLDSSVSIPGSGFDLMKSFASNLVESFSISAVDSHIGAITAGATPKVQFNFGQSYNVKKIQGELNAMEYDPSIDGKLGTALNVANQDLYSIKGRARRGVPKVMVIVTDGNFPPEQEALIAKQAKVLKSVDVGTEIIVVAVGPRAANSAVLKSIVSSSPTGANFIKLGRFEDLATYTNQLLVAEQMCSAKIPGFECPPVPPRSDCLIRDNECESDFDCPGTMQCCPNECRRRCILTMDDCSDQLDLLLILDDSARVGPINFLKLKNFVNTLLESFSVSKGFTHVAALTYSESAKVAFNFNDIRSYNLSDVTAAIDRIPYSSGRRSRLDKALELASSKGLTSSAGARISKEVKQAIIIFTDGNSAADSKRLDVASWPLRYNKVRIMSITVGDSVNEKALENVVSLPIQNNVFLASNYDDIQKNVRELTKASCEPASLSPQAPTVFSPGPPGPPGPKGNKGGPGPDGDQGSIGNNGRVGPAGPAGPQGVAGDEGPQGLPGLPGGNTKGPDPLFGAVGLLQGQSGADPVFDYQPGQEGPPGAPGKPGPAGEPGAIGGGGDRGQNGTVGKQGKFGPRGAVGQTGTNGPKGEVGPGGDAGPRGLQGDAGAQGVPGLQGPFGFKGESGIQGPSGDEGDAGLAGEKGYQGEKGAQGDAGDVGPSGPLGLNGALGAVGQRGPRGQDGTPGEPGNAGVEGLKGPPGRRGLQGTKGNQGSAGPRGDKGGSGDQGQTGEQGAKGQGGPTGPAGKEGAVGAKGNIGDRGAAGPPGLVGEVGPQGAQGNRGLLGPNGNKGEPGIRGPRGVAGVKGATGNNGLIGPAGPQGQDGASGTPGQDGPPGPPGPTGERGRSGRAGDAGANGGQGAKGNSGDTGTPGKGGEKGARGARGQIGEQGEPGPRGGGGQPGLPGRNGKPGPQGPAGKDGSTGAPGPQGQQGFQGSIGPQGARGSSGPDGAQGAAGKNGRKGAGGEAGPSGPRGVPGLLGLAGSRGDQGAPGLAGPNGMQGPSGPPGAAGSTGKVGAAGAKGKSGGNGIAGPQGQGGALGLQGLAGGPGRQGVTGERGDNGLQGPRGDKGADGTPGRAGPTGAPGAGGIPGATGARGAKGMAGFAGTKGDSGVDGITGERGEQGPGGINGVPGRPGEIGPDGPIGAPGIDGPGGDIGVSGPPGLPGRTGSQGVAGPPGAGGPRGLKGHGGDDGDTGIPGRPGQSGASGKVGSIGQLGQAGESGDIGALGETGPQGISGSSGRVGPVGAMGPVGPAGNDGKTGRAGSQGNAGSPGKRGGPGTEGLPGRDGTPGQSGNPGKSGKKGPQGPAGPQGNRGAGGIDGMQGVVGRPGEKGANGKPGKDGKDGRNGKRGLAGKTGLQGGAGEVGKSGVAGGAGEDGVNGLPGADGSKGEQGYRGPSGQPGETGSPGKPGPGGQKGETGITGYRGGAGVQGKPGKKGETGDQGARGSQGSKGTLGPAGRKGSKGEMGMYGIHGPPGTTGSKGDRGSGGPQGPSGPPGPRGGHGPDGQSGPRGNAGQKGAAGSKGYDGPTGVAGDPGIMGEPGPPGPTGVVGAPGEISGLSGSMIGWLANGGLEKGPQYYGQYYRKKRTSRVARSIDDNDDQWINRDYTTFREYYDLLKRFDNFRHGTGKHTDPARTCNDLFLWYPWKKSGDYWVDPNEGSPDDKVLVFCNKTSNETCIYPRQMLVEKDKWHTGKDTYKWIMKDILMEDEGILYAADMRQIKIMKLFSSRARQNITYFCRNSHAWQTPKMVAHKTLKLKTDNDHDIHGHSKDPLVKPKVVLDECKIKDGKWHKTILELDTNQLDYMPILDVATYDIGDKSEEFGLEIGPICFS